MFVLDANNRFMCALFDLSEGSIEDQLHDAYLEYPEIRDLPFKRVRIARQKAYEVGVFLTADGIDPDDIALWDEISVDEIDAYRGKADVRGGLPFPYNVDGTFFFVLYPKNP